MGYREIDERSFGGLCRNNGMFGEDLTATEVHKTHKHRAAIQMCYRYECPDYPFDCPTQMALCLSFPFVFVCGLHLQWFCGLRL